MSSSSKIEIIDRRKIPFTAHSFKVYTCGDPECGPHIAGCDEAGNIQCEIIVGYDDVPSLCNHLLDLKEKRYFEK